MKKLFFAALVATVAVGGAFAQTYRNTELPNQPNTVKFTCDGTITPTCGSEFPAGFYDDVTGTPITSSDAPYLVPIQYL